MLYDISKCHLLSIMHVLYVSKDIYIKCIHFHKNNRYLAFIYINFKTHLTLIAVKINCTQKLYIPLYCLQSSGLLPFNISVMIPLFQVWGELQLENTVLYKCQGHRAIILYTPSTILVISNPFPGLLRKDCISSFRFDSRCQDFSQQCYVFYWLRVIMFGGWIHINH